MRFAAISDVHSNLEALQAVLDDAERARVEAIVCLGDVIGYGPNPRETLDLVRKVASAVVLGNHEVLVGREIPEHTAPQAAQAALWTRRMLRPPRGSKVEVRLPGSGRLVPASEEAQAKHRHKRARWAWLRSLPTCVVFDGVLLAHGTPADPFDYVFGPIEAQRVLESQMKGAGLLLLGHTHVPAIALTDGRTLAFARAEEGRIYSLRGFTAIVNVGAVGQPRDHDPRASYGIVREDRSVEIRRVPYDAEKTAAKIRAVRALPAALADRLLCGE